MMARQPMPMSSRWRQGAVLTSLVGFTVLGVLASLVSRDQPPIPARVVAGDQVVFTRDDIVGGMHVFQRYGLMPYGSVDGHGAYRGPDGTAEYLHLSAEFLINACAGARAGGLSARARVAVELHANTYSPADGALIWSATRGEAHLALGATLSAMEVISFWLLTLEAWSLIHTGAQKTLERDHLHRWAVWLLVSVGVWNVLGAGVCGFFITLPIASYDDIGTALTANHAHTAMLGVYGMLAAGLLLVCRRDVMRPARWSDRAATLSCWSLNIGLAWMACVHRFPLGIVQLYEAVDTGYAYARSVDVTKLPWVKVLEWVRLPGDARFIVGGVVPLVWL